MNTDKQLPVAIIGAGPVGLAAAAHLAERNIDFLLLESGTEIGENVRSWAHVRIFSPWNYNVDQAARRLLQKNGWQEPPSKKLPTGQDLLELYMLPLSQLPEIRQRLYLRTTVLSISRRGIDKVKSPGRGEAPFVIHARQNSDCCSKNIRFFASAVIDVSGTWQNPNPMGADGYFADGEEAAAEQIYYGIPDVLGAQKERFSGCSVAVVGNGHSAIQVLLDLAKPGSKLQPSKIYWVIRSSNFSPDSGAAVNDALPARGALNNRISALIEQNKITLKTGFYVQKVARTQNKLSLLSGDGMQIDDLDQIVVATGSRPNLDMLREIRVELDPALESVGKIGPLIDPNIHSCGTVPPHGERELRQPEPGFYIAGIKSYGRAPTFLMATGYEQVRSIVAALAGDRVAAENVQLSLPETGVCSSDLQPQKSGCCDADARPQNGDVEAACCKVEVAETDSSSNQNCC